MSNGDTFYTLDAPAEGIYKEKMSKFLAFAVPVTSAVEAKEVVARYQKEYFDARHVCWAYMIGAARTEFLSNDNGEPSGTAGKPILGQINSFNLTNIVIIVVRYFGEHSVLRDRLFCRFAAGDAAICSKSVYAPQAYFSPRREK